MERLCCWRSTHQIELIGPRGHRRISLTSFFTDYRRCALAPGELIVAIDIPKPFPAFTRFYKVAKRRMDDISTMSRFPCSISTHPAVCPVRASLSAALPHAFRVYSAEEAILGQRWTEAAAKQAQAALRVALKPIGDHRGSGAYRHEVAQSLVEVLLRPRGGARMNGPSGNIVGKPQPHESARGHVTGEALYTDDLCQRFPAFCAWPVCAPPAAYARQID